MFWLLINSIKLIMITYLTLFISGDLEWGAFRVLMLITAILILMNQGVLSLQIKDERLILPASTNKWDRRSIFLYQDLGPLGIFIFAAVDHRFKWTEIFPNLTFRFDFNPVVVFLLMHVLFCLVWTLLQKNNPFYVKTFRIQHERHHRIIETGLYGIIRHPGYLIEGLILINLPFVLNTWIALIPAVLSCIVLVIRTHVEDLVLRRHFQGYYEYQKRVRYRLFPWIW